MAELLHKLSELKRERETILRLLDTNSREDRTKYFCQLIVIDDKIERVKFEIQVRRAIYGKHR